MTTPTDLATDWILAKQAENAARDARIQVEREIIEALGCEEEGSKTHDLDGIKVTITGKINRAISLRSDIGCFSMLESCRPCYLKSLVKYG